MWIRSNIDALTSWPTANNISPGNLYAGEYGATRDNTGFPGDLIGNPMGSHGSTRLDRMHLYRDMSQAIVANGHRREFDHLDTMNYGITTAQNLTVGPFDQRLLEAVAPTQNWLRP